MKAVCNYSFVFIKSVCFNYFFGKCNIFACIYRFVFYIKPVRRNPCLDNAVVHSLCLTHRFITALSACKYSFCIRIFLQISNGAVYSACKHHTRAVLGNLSAKYDCGCILFWLLYAGKCHQTRNNQTVAKKCGKAKIDAVQNNFAENIFLEFFF